jgi:hypothetical protein
MILGFASYSGSECGIITRLHASCQPYSSLLVNLPAYSSCEDSSAAVAAEGEYKPTTLFCYHQILFGGFLKIFLVVLAKILHFNNVENSASS